MANWQSTTWHLLLIGFLFLSTLKQTKAWETAWENATATWYPGYPGQGSPDTGNCDYGALSATAYGSMATAVSSALYLNGTTCGACYEVMCTSSPLCSGKPVTVTVTDSCPGGGNPNWCGDGNIHFDMTKEAFQSMAVDGEEKNFPNYFEQLLYRRVECSYPRRNVRLAFKKGSNPYWIGLLPRDVGGPGIITHASIQTSDSDVFLPMIHSNWGAIFQIHPPKGSFKGPFTIRLENKNTSEMITCPNKLPETYDYKTTYDCGAQFRIKKNRNPLDPKDRPPLTKSPRKTPKPQPPKPQSPKPPLLKPPFPEGNILRNPPNQQSPPTSPPNDANHNIQISQKLLDVWFDGSDTISHYAVDFKNIGAEPINTVIFEAANLYLSGSGSYNLAFLPDNKYTLQSYVFPLSVGNYGEFGYFNIGGEATFFIASQS